MGDGVPRFESGASKVVAGPGADWRGKAGLGMAWRGTGYFT